MTRATRRSGVPRAVLWLPLAFAAVGCGGAFDSAAPDATGVSARPAAIAAGEIEDACLLLSESDAEAILGRDLGSPVRADGAYDNVACSYAAPGLDQSDIYIEVMDCDAEGASCGGTAEQSLIAGAEQQSRMPGVRQRELPAAQAAYLENWADRPEYAYVQLAVGDHIVMLTWRRTGETFDEQTHLAIAFVDAISAELGQTLP